MNNLIMYTSNNYLKNKTLFFSSRGIQVNVVIISRRILPVIQIVRTMRASQPLLASEIGRWHRGRLSRENKAFGKDHEALVDSSLRTDKKASQSNTALTTKPYAHKVDPAVSETAILSETTLAKGGKGTQYYTWKDFGKTRVNQYQIKNNFTSRRPTTPEEEANFQAAKLLQNKPVYRHKDVTAQGRFCNSTELKKPMTLEEKEAKKHKLNAKEKIEEKTDKKDATKKPNKPNKPDKKDEIEKLDKTDKNEGNDS